ncbi:DUF4280 domain-containing protein [Paenibacillus alba]|uniref:DUF4280 domain-containing protein n=1 Tax=Paenibacillus alba TaxID=1197127 RepID=UPI001564096B|nr:DUF4280 domain-containing protein [Paenibacillus alba]NQX66868.1 DUF4280 domain-containing protein [Paenibacillus alba]
MSENEFYIVRGAQMVCSCGSHKRRINLPQSHGSYVNDKPMMNEGDYLFHVNVPHFGICTSPLNPSGETIYLIAENGQTISGKPCCPLQMGKWMQAKENAIVDGKPALTTVSRLVCGYQNNKGEQGSGEQQDKEGITFITNGQQDT